MFEFLKDVDNYESRCVERSEFDWGYISTAKVNDGRKPYETAIKHTRYHDNKITIVEAYDTVEEAKAGHERWVSTMTADQLPESLTDCENACIAHTFGLGEIYPLQPLPKVNELE